MKQKILLVLFVMVGWSALAAESKDEPITIQYFDPFGNNPPQELAIDPQTRSKDQTAVEAAVELAGKDLLQKQTQEQLAANPSALASSAATGSAKNTHTCAPSPERETSTTAGTPRSCAAWAYACASNCHWSPSKSQASSRQVSSGNIGYMPAAIGPDR